MSSKNKLKNKHFNKKTSNLFSNNINKLKSTQVSGTFIAKDDGGKTTITCYNSPGPMIKANTGHGPQ